MRGIHDRGRSGSGKKRQAAGDGEGTGARVAVFDQGIDTLPQSIISQIPIFVNSQFSLE
jgi:hypothetical protein